MIHVKIKMASGMPKKAWFIGAVSNREGIIVYKDDPKKYFVVTDLQDIMLDIFTRNPAEPVVDSLKDVNLKLKKGKQCHAYTEKRCDHKCEQCKEYF